MPRSPRSLHPTAVPLHAPLAYIPRSHSTPLRSAAMSVGDLAALTATLTMSDSVHDCRLRSSSSGSSTPASSLPSNTSCVSSASSLDRTPDSERSTSFDIDQLSNGNSISEEEGHDNTHHHHVNSNKSDRRTNHGVGGGVGIAGVSRKIVEPSERRTVFIPNLPRDATAREMNLMFAFCPGFIKCQLYDQLKSNEGQRTPIGTSPDGSNTGLTHFGAFILFESPAAAIFARDRLNGFVFDASAPSPVVLQARIAMKNLFLSREEQVDLFQLSGLVGGGSLKASRRNSLAGTATPTGTGAHHQHVIPPSEIARMTQIQAEYAQGQFSPILQPGIANAGTPPFQPFSPSEYTSPALGAFAQAVPPPGYYHLDSATSPQQSHSPVQHLQQNAYACIQQNGGGWQASPVGIGAYRTGAYTPYGHHHSHPHGVGPLNPPCTTLFLARLEHLTDDELLQLLVNSFPTMINSKFMIDSKGQRIGKHTQTRRLHRWSCVTPNHTLILASHPLSMCQFFVVLSFQPSLSSILWNPLRSPSSASMASRASHAHSLRIHSAYDQSKGSQFFLATHIHTPTNTSLGPIHHPPGRSLTADSKHRQSCQHQTNTKQNDAS